MTVNADGLDEGLAREIVAEIRGKGLKTTVLEAGAIPWPNAGLVLCINFVPAVHLEGSRTAINPYIAAILNHAVSKRISEKYSAIQVGVSTNTSDKDTPNFKRVARFFVDGDRLRSLERTPAIIQEESLEKIGSWT